MGLNHQKIQDKQAKKKSVGWKPREGDNRVRILPPTSRYFQHPDELDDFAVEYALHFFKIQGRQTEVSRCLEDLGMKCPACSMWRAYNKSDDPGYKELAKQIARANYFLFNMIDLGNPQAGIQRWGANYTCHSGIMEIGGNPAWGEVISVESGINFIIKLIPQQKSPTGYNQYKVSPEPRMGDGRDSVLPLLQAIPNWWEVLDKLEEDINPAMSVEEINGLLAEMGFPIPGGSGGGQSFTPPATQTGAAPAPGSPPPAAVSTSSGPPMGVPVGGAPAGIPGGTGTTSAPPGIPTGAGAGVVDSPQAAVQVAAPPVDAGAAHYDPGPAYVPKHTVLPPKGPRCFGDYTPQLHQCATCPVQTDCQMVYLGAKKWPPA